MARGFSPVNRKQVQFDCLNVSIVWYETSTLDKEKFNAV